MKRFSAGGFTNYSTVILLLAGLTASNVSTGAKPTKRILNESANSSIEISNPVIARSYFDGNYLTESFIHDLTRDTKRDLLYWSDCRASINFAKDLELPIVEPDASGCLYLVFGVPDSRVGDSYEEWVDYWLLDEPCDGKQSSGCYLGYVIDTRINNESSTHRASFETTIQSSHKYWATQKTSRSISTVTNTSVTTDISPKSTQQSLPKEKSGYVLQNDTTGNKTGSTARSKARAAPATSDLKDNAQEAWELEDIRELLYAGSVSIDQTISGNSRKEIITSYFDANDEPIGEPMLFSTIASSGASEESCEAAAIDAGDSVGETVHDVVQGGTTLAGAFTGGAFGTAFGVIGGAAAGSSTMGPGPGTAVGAAVGAGALGTTGTAAGGTIGNVLGDYTGAAAGWLADAITTAVVGAGCESTPGSINDHGGQNPDVTENPAGGGSSGGTVVVLDSQTDEETDKDEDDEQKEDTDDTDDDEEDKKKD